MVDASTFEISRGPCKRVALRETAMGSVSQPNCRAKMKGYKQVILWP